MSPHADHCPTCSCEWDDEDDEDDCDPLDFETFPDDDQNGSSGDDQ